MKVELELWHLFLIFFAFVSFASAFGKVLLDQIEKRLDERFKARDSNQAAVQAEWRAMFNKLDEASREMERDFHQFQVRLPESYVRRDDYIRGQTVIEAKLDALHSGQSELRTLVASHERT